MTHFATIFGIMCLIPVCLHGTPEPTVLNQLQQALGVPESIAKVTDGYLRPNNTLPEMILFQDVHRHPEVQGDIAAVVLYGSHHWGLKDVYLEGAQAGTEVAISRDGTVASLRNAVQTGLLSGAEMAAALEPDSSLELHGLEDPNLYRENVEAYERTEHLRDLALQELDTAQVLQDAWDVPVDRPGATEIPLLIKLLQLRLKPAEHEAFMNNPYNGPTNSALRDAILEAEHFYSIADERSEAFLRNAERSSADVPRLLVVGGFHTEKMASLLRSQGHSFVVLTPHVTQTGYDELYARGMHQTISALKLD
jgi:hypothetical protein